MRRVDGTKVTLKEHWPRIKEDLLADRYQPQAVRGVEIPKPGGGVRLYQPAKRLTREDERDSLCTAVVIRSPVIRLIRGGGDGGGATQRGNERQAVS